jgi:ornithine cyclodeaminase/alanine dehydrogenase-like protein (mu-crystallin family)
MDTKIEFLYLSEQDTIDAGVNDAQACVKTCQEVFRLLASGDYLMGGPNRNSHGLGLVFPKETPFPNMPVAGPDRRFVAMPAYLGGRFGICGNKWYGSNAANTAKGLPRSILTVILNDTDTGAPLCMMSANLLSAARTGGVPGVAVKELARKDSKIAAVVGCGPINNSCFRHIASQLPMLEKVYCFDLFLEKAQAMATQITQKLGIAAEATDSLEYALKDSDVITVAASRLKPLHMDSSWLKKGATVLLTGPANGNKEFWTKSHIVLDHTPLHQNYVSEAIDSGDKAGYYAGVIGGPIYTLIDNGELPPLTEFSSIGQILNGEKAGRTNDEEIIVFVACGMAVFDIGVGFDVYTRAKERGIGQTLKLWDKPAQG